MVAYYLFIVIVVALIFLLGVTFGHSLITLKLRKEENKKRELELAMIEKQPQILKKRKEMNETIEDILFRANVEKEINNMLRKNESN